MRRAVLGAAPARNWTWLWIALLTLLAAVLRFARSDQPPLWGDESAVFWRTCGSYRQLLAILQNDGFAPLHYELYWVLRHLMPMTARAMRFVPSLAATLMVPAMYLLACQLVSRRGALLAAAFTSVSGFLAWYAHDAKMYMHFWLFCTLNMASLLWWLRAGRRLAWLAWIATGLAVVGLHSLGWGVIALQPLLLLTAPRLRWTTTVAFLTGLAVIGAGPAGYYLGFNRWTTNIRSYGWQASGIAWIEQINGSATGLDLARVATTHYLVGNDYPPLLPLNPSWDWLRAWIRDLPGIVLLVTALGLFPWPTRRRARPRTAMPLGAAPPAFPAVWWRGYLYVSAWVLLPIYAFYCATFGDYAWPGDLLRALFSPSAESHGLVALAATVAGYAWPPELLNAIGGRPSELLTGVLSLLRPLREPRVLLGVALVIAAAALYCSGRSWPQRLLRLTQLILVSLALFLAATGIAWTLQSRPPGPLWVSRYSAFVWPAFITGISAVLVRVPLLPLRWLLIGVLLGLNLWQSVLRIGVGQDAPIDRLARDVIAAQGESATTRTYGLGLDTGGALSTNDGRYYLFSLSGRSTYPEEFAGSYIGSLFRFSDASTVEELAQAVRDPVPSQGSGASQPIQRLIVWDSLPPDPAQARPFADTTTDPLLPLLPAGWQRISATIYPYYSRWEWGQKGMWRRREYVRPATQPASTPPPSHTLAAGREGPGIAR